LVLDIGQTVGSKPGDRWTRPGSVARNAHELVEHPRRVRLAAFDPLRAFRFPEPYDGEGGLTADPTGPILAPALVGGGGDVSLVPTDEELAISVEISGLGESLWAKSERVTGLFTDREMLSVLIYRRLWSNHRGFVQLWRNALPTEADIILLSGLEAAICIAANRKLGSDFGTMLRQNAAFTVMGQIAMHRQNDEAGQVARDEEVLRDLTAGLPEGVGAAKLDYMALAREGGVPRLYEWHRQLSGVSSHVTGVSIIYGVTDETEKVNRMQARWREMSNRMRPMMMCSATLTGSLLHAEVIGSAGHLEAARTLNDRLDEIAKLWPGLSE
jgi:hypothetical protein